MKNRDLKTEEDNLSMEKETAFKHIDEEQKITKGLRAVVDQLKDEKLDLEKKLEAVTGEFSILKEKFEHAEHQVTNISHTLKVTEEEHESVKLKLSQVLAQIMALQKEKEDLVLHCERTKEEHTEKLNMVEKELASKTTDHQRMLEKQEEAYQKLNIEYKQIESWFQECKVKLKVAEKKIEELTEEFQKGIESKDQMIVDLEETEDLKRDLEVKGDEFGTLLENVGMLEVKLRLSNQTLRVTEQLLSEDEERFRKTEQKFLQDQSATEDRIATLLAIIAANKK